MEEKKKRGRPPGSGKKVFKEGWESAKDYKPSEQERYDSGPHVKEFKDEAVDIKNSIKERHDKALPEFPADWDKMGKVDRLKWLTANKK